MKSFLFSWKKFFTHNLISATVEQGAKAHIIITCRTLKPFHDAVAGNFTTTGSGAARTCSNYSASGNVINLTMNAAYVLAETLTLSFNPTKKGATVTKVVTNNISS